MEASKGKDFITSYEKGRSFLSAWLGLILTILAVIVIFVVAALEGSKEIRASNSESGFLLTMWRQETQVTEGFPEPYVTVIEYESKGFMSSTKDYYFVIEEQDPVTQEIITWYWAYDGGIGYVFSDYKHYVLVGITFVFSIFVSVVNYNSTIDKATKTTNFKKTLIYYQKKKEKISGYTQLLPSFCAFKTKEAYTQEKQSIVESANLDWDDFIKEKIKEEELETWQLKRLKKIEKIKIIKLKSNDLLYETRYGGKKIRLLPQSQEEHKKIFLYKGIATKFATSFMSGLVAGFGVILGNWVLGLVFGFAIVLSAVGSVVSAADYATNTLKNRYIGKGELLSEFDNVKEVYKTENEIKNEERELIEKTRKEAEQQEKEVLEKDFEEEEKKHSKPLINAV